MRGSVLQRKRKRGTYWYAVYDSPAFDGKRKQVWEKADPNTRASAQRLLSVRLAQIHRGEWEHPHKPVPFRDLAEKWFRISVKPRAASNSLDAYTTWLNNHVLPHFGGTDARLLSSEDLQAFAAAKLEQGLAVGYVKQLVWLVRAVVRQGVEWGHLRVGAADLKVRFPRVQKEEIDPFTPAEIQDLLAAAPDRWRPYLVMAVWTGMRQGELMAAKWGNIDWEKGQYHVRENITRRMEFSQTKSANAAPVFLSPYVMDVLRAHRATVSEWQLLSIEWADLDLIFPNRETGKPWTHAYLRKVFRAICDEAQIRYRPPHHLRHTCASLLLHQGESVKLVQKQLRHKDPTVTLGIYAHLMPEAGTEALKKLDVTIFGEAATSGLTAG